MEFGRIRGNSGNFEKMSGELSGTQWNAVGLCMALNMNSVGFYGGLGGNAGNLRKNLGFGVVSGDLGPPKAFAHIAKFRAGKKNNKQENTQIKFSRDCPGTVPAFS